jgi:hypothetical protein
MLIKDYYQKSGLSYDAIGKKTRPNLEKSQVYHCIFNPWRVTLYSFLAVASVLGYSDDSARDEWAEEKAKKQKELIDEEARNPKPRKTRRGRPRR